MARILALFAFLLSLLLGTDLIAQPKSKANDFVSGTSTTQQVNTDKFKRSKFTNRSRDLPQIVRSNAKGILYGNLCAREVAAKMGFEYLIMPPGGESESGFLDKWGNFKTRVSLTLRYGPWWKATFNHRVRKCRRATLDHNAI
jgi:hypothetical protein